MITVIIIIFKIFCDVCLVDLIGGVTWSGEYAIAESVVMGYGG